MVTQPCHACCSKGEGRKGGSRLRRLGVGVRAKRVMSRPSLSVVSRPSSLPKVCLNYEPVHRPGTTLSATSPVCRNHPCVGCAVRAGMPMSNVAKTTMNARVPAAAKGLFSLK